MADMSWRCHVFADHARPGPGAVTYGLGVDLGTTFTAVAVGRQDRTEMVSLGNRSTVVPSVVFASTSGRLLTGDAADRKAAQEPGRAAREFKRRLGDPTPLLLAGAPFPPAALLAAVLRDAVDSATRLEGAPPERVVLSRPAVWGPYRLEQFDQVPHLAGLSDVHDVHMVTEPLAAATYYTAARSLADGDVVGVYDLGGGTFDSAVLLFKAGEMQILGTPEGVEWLGGVDFDEAVLRHVDNELDGAVSAADPRNPDDAVALSRLRQECVLAKEALSFDEETVVPVFLSSARSNVRLTRAQFEDMIRPAVASTVEGLHRALKSAEVRAADVSAVLLAGGSSRIPLVARMVESSLGRPTIVDAHPKHVVALGAAHIAATLLVPSGAAVAPPPAQPGERTPGDAPPPDADTGGQDPAESLPPAGDGPPPSPDTSEVPPDTSERQKAHTGRWARTTRNVRAAWPAGAARRLRTAWPIRTTRTRSQRPDSAPVVNRRDLVVALFISIVVLTLAALIGTLYGYAHRTTAPASSSATAERLAPDGNPLQGISGG